MVLALLYATGTVSVRQLDIAVDEKLGIFRI